jgi:hypothetical protein
MKHYDELFLENLVQRAVYQLCSNKPLLQESISPILLEGIGGKDISRLKEQVQNAKDSLAEINDILGDTINILPNIQAALKKLAKNMPSTTEIVALKFMGGKKQIAKAVVKVSVGVNKVHLIRTSIYNALSLLAEGFAELDFIKEILSDPNHDAAYEFKELNLQSFVANYKDELPPIKSIVTGIKRSYKEPPAATGWLGKAANVFGGLFGTSLTVRKFVKDISLLTFKQVIQIGQNIDPHLNDAIKAEKEARKTSEKVLDGVTQVNDEKQEEPAAVKKVKKLKSDTVYEYTTIAGKNKGKVRKVNVIGPSEKEGYYQAQLQKKNGEFTKDEYSLPLKGFGDQVNESNFVNR